MKTILVIDDDRRLKGLEVDGNTVIHAKTSGEGMRLLNHYALMVDLDELWLDHDLGGDDTIREVVDTLEFVGHEGQPYPVNQIMVHSVNAPAASRMMAALSPYYNVRRVSIEELSALCGAVLLGEPNG